MGKSDSGCRQRWCWNQVKIDESWLCTKIIATRDGDKLSVLESDDNVKMKECGYVMKIHRQKRGTPWSRWSIKRQVCLKMRIDVEEFFDDQKDDFKIIIVKI